MGSMAFALLALCSISRGELERENAAAAAALVNAASTEGVTAFLESLELRGSAGATNPAIAEREAYDAELNQARDVLFIETLLEATNHHDEGALYEELAPTVAAAVGEAGSASAGETVFLEAGAGAVSFAEMQKVHAYCEICIRMLQMYQQGLPDVTSGLKDGHFITVRRGDGCSLTMAAAAARGAQASLFLIRAVAETASNARANARARAARCALRAVSAANLRAVSAANLRAVTARLFSTALGLSLHRSLLSCAPTVPPLSALSLPSHLLARRASRTWSRS